MQTKRQFLLPLLAAATAMMVAPHANASTNYDYPTAIGADTLYTAGTALIDGDVLNIYSGTVSAAAATTTAGATINVKAGSVLTTSTNNNILTSGAGAAAPLALTVAGTMTANTTSNMALSAAAWTLGGANSVSVSIPATGLVTGDINPADGNAAGATNITVNGQWIGDLKTTATSTAASTLTVSGANAKITGRLNGIKTSTTANTAAFVLKMNQGAQIAAATANGAAITVVTPASSPLTLDVDTGASVITGNVVGGAAANSVLNLGAVDAANSASLTVTGTFDGLKINQLVPGTLQFNGKVGNANVTGAVALSAGITQFKDTANTAAIVFSGTNQSTFTTSLDATAVTLQNKAVVTVGTTLGNGAAVPIVVGDSSSLTVTGATSATTFQTNTTNTSGASATFVGNFVATGAVTVVNGTSATFNAVYTQGGASTNAGSMNFLGSNTLTFTGGMTNNVGGAIVVGKPDGSVAATITTNITAAGGTVYLHKGTIVSGNLSAAGGTITLGKGVVTTGTAASSANGTFELMPGAGINNATNAPGAGGVFKIHATEIAGTIVPATITGGNYTPNATGTTTIVFDNSVSYGQLSVLGANNAAFNTNNAPFSILHTGGYVVPGAYQVVITSTGTVGQTSGLVTVVSPTVAAGSLNWAVDVASTATQISNKAVTVTITRPKGLNTFATDSNTQALLASVNNVGLAAYQNASAGQQSVLNFIENTVATNYQNPTAIARAMQGLMPNVSSLGSVKTTVRNNLYTVGQRLDNVAYDMSSPRAYVAGSNNGDAVWMRGTFTNVNQKANASTNYDGYTSNQWGAMVGFDTMRFMHTTLGLSLGYNQSNSKDRYNRASFNRVRSYQVMPYGSVTLGDRATKGFIDWFAGYTYSSVTGTRVVPVTPSGINTYSYNSSMFSAKGTYGLDRVINRNLTFTPFVSALVSYQPSVSYTEQGYAQKNIQNNSNLGLEFELGVKGVIRPDAGSKANTRIAFRAMGVWSAINNNLKSTATFVGAQSFTYSVTQQKFGARAGVSGVFEVLNDLDLELSYDVEARSKYMSQTGFVEFKYHF